MIGLQEIQAARARIAPHVRTTPVTRDDRLSAWIKWENRQVTHSFKPRGALNKVLALNRKQLERGLLACSAGNHGQGVALAGKLTGAAVTVYVPAGAAPIKIEKMTTLGAQIVKTPGQYGEAEAAAIAAAREQGKTYLSPYNDPQVIAGAGTVALEWLEQMPDLDALIIPLGGGGLIAGIGLAAKALRPAIKIIGAQSENSAYLHAEFHGRDMSRVTELPTLADGLAGSVEPGSITIELLHQIADEVILVTEAEIERAIAYAHHRHGEVIEGAGAVGIAAALAGKLASRGQVGLLVSGGNIDSEKHASICKRMTSDQ